MILCDYLTVSTPLHNGQSMYDACADVCLRLEDAQLLYNAVSVGHGRLHYRERHSVATISASGVLLSRLRSAHALFEFLAAIANNGPYKVTHLDVARDEQQDAPSYLAMLYGRLRVTGAKLTRKRIHPDEVVTMFSRGPDGRDTGSIMLGDRRSQETTAIVYDRQADAKRKGKPDPGPLVRTEVRTGVPGMSLKDAYEPAALFWYFAAPTFGEKPSDVPDWQPWGEGFQLEPKPTIDVPAVMGRLLDTSHDVQRLLDLADKLPGDGLRQLQQMFANRCVIHKQTVMFAAGTAQAVGDSGRSRH